MESRWMRRLRRELVPIIYALLLTSGAASFPKGPLGGGRPGWMPRGIKLFAEASRPQPAGHEQCVAADELMKKRGADNYMKAYKQYKQLLASDPDNNDLKFKVAEASVSYLRSLTNANAVMIDGIGDSSENRRLWKEYAPEAYSLLQELHKASPHDAKTHILKVEAFTYSTSSKGILKAAVKGDGFTFMKYVDQIVNEYPTFDSGISHIFKGAFLLAAPWPLKDIKKARQSFGEAIKVEPRSLRNNYYGGVSAWHDGDYAQARHYFKFAVNEAQSVAGTEKDVGAFFMREAKRGLDAANAKLNIDAA